MADKSCSYIMSQEEEYKGPWQSAPVECPICTHQWVAVWPAITDELECPHCGNISEPIIREV